MIAKHKHPKTQRVLVFDDHCLERTLALRASVPAAQVSEPAALANDASFARP
jgi:hypothetical protein